MPYSDPGYIELIECPRDAMQGIHEFIPTAEKINYLQHLLAVGFDVLDAGSFVSAKAIPQLQDTAEVLSALNLTDTSTRLLVIVANLRGAEEAVLQEKVTYLGFPLSVSETFQQRNTNKSISEALTTVSQIQQLLKPTNKKLVVYLSMGFGNPYGDPYSPGLLKTFVLKLKEMGVQIVSLADTVGVATAQQIHDACSSLIPEFPEVSIGVHLHARPDGAAEKLKAAFDAGCRRFDGALGGFGGCPMAGDTLVGNMPTEQILNVLPVSKLNKEALLKASAISQKLFSKYV